MTLQVLAIPRRSSMAKKDKGSKRKRPNDGDEDESSSGEAKVRVRSIDQVNDGAKYQDTSPHPRLVVFIGCESSPISRNVR